MRVAFVGPAIGAVAVAFIAAGASSGLPVSFGAPSEHAMPADGVAYVQSHVADRHLYNDYNWGGYLVYKRVPVFIDGRTDFYRAKILDDYATIGKVEPGWNFLVDEYGIEAMLLRPDSHLARTMRGYGGWREVYAGDDSSVFVRDAR